eukprot:633091-Lingulodinium_polyedra.AAC.1
MRYSAISQLVRDSVRNAVPFLCFGKKGAIWSEPRARNIMEGCCPTVKRIAHRWCPYKVGALD